MECGKWTKSITKPNGELRKQFWSWAIPAEIKNSMSVQDRMSCLVTLKADTSLFEFETKVG